MRTDRRLWKYIVFNALTLGIYGLVFIYSLAQDVNTVCRDDGKNTRGLGQWILLNIITLGIYSVVWYYGVAERIGNAQRRFGTEQNVSGDTVLIWFIIGYFLIFIAEWYAMYKIINGANEVCVAYNALNHFHY